VSHCGLAIYIKKYLKAKEELWKLKYISPCKNIIFKKNPLKETKIVHNSITNLKFLHKPKHHVSKILIIKIELLLLLRGQNPLSYYIL
jgi:hypothetical protein